MEDAWAKYVQEVQSKEATKEWEQSTMESEWFRILSEMFPGKQPDQITPAEWAVVVKEVAGKILPF
jgi:hypothetical protein